MNSLYYNYARVSLTVITVMLTHFHPVCRSLLNGGAALHRNCVESKINAGFLFNTENLFYANKTCFTVFITM